MKLGSFVTIMKSMCYVHVVNAYLIEPVAVSLISVSTCLKLCFVSKPFVLLQTIGPSMLPTIDLTASWFLTEKISTRLGKVDRGDIVILRDPQNPRLMLTKRVVGLEGDRITHKHNSETNKLKGGGFTYISKPKTHELESDSLTYSSNPETNDLVGDNSSHISYPENLKPETIVVWSISSYKLNSHFYFIILIMGSALLVF